MVQIFLRGIQKKTGKTWEEAKQYVIEQIGITPSDDPTPVVTPTQPPTEAATPAPLLPSPDILISTVLVPDFKYEPIASV